MCPPDPIVVTVDIINSPSPLIGSATIRSVASTSEAVQLITAGPQGAKGETGSTGNNGTTGPTGSMPSDYVISINGVTGGITGVAKTNVVQSFTQRQGFADGIFVTGQATFPDTVNLLGNVTINTDSSRTLIVNGDTSFNGNSVTIKGVRVSNNARNWYFI